MLILLTNIYIFKKKNKRNKRIVTCCSCGDDISVGVPGMEEQPGFVVRMFCIKMREGDVDAADPNPHFLAHL